jgi:hypothetical protein
MIALPKDRPLVDGENEYITIERIVPAFKGRNHMFADYWVAEGTLDGILMRLTVLHEDRKMFLDAGYVPAEIMTLNPKTVHIDVRTMKDARNRWRVAEVIHGNETDHVHSEAERQTAWLADLITYRRKVTVDGTTARFECAGELPVVWTKDEHGRYIRTCDGVRKVFAAKVQS